MKNVLFKKVISMALVFSMMLLLIVGCGSKDNNDAEPQNSTTEDSKPDDTKDQKEDYGDTGGLELPIVDKPVTIKILASTNVTNLEEKFVMQELEKRTGIKLDIQEVPDTGSAYSEKFNVILSSGKLPDIMLTGAYKEINAIGDNSGAFVDLNEYVDILPNFKSIFVDDPENSWALKSYSSPQGKMYMWPKYNANRTVNHGYLYRKDIFDKNGIKAWTNTDEFYDALKKLKEIYPDSIPFASKLQGNIFNRLSYGWGIVVPTTEGGQVVYYNEDEKVWKPSVTAPEFKDMLDFMKKLYDEGLLDPEFLTDTEASWSGKMTQEDKAFVTFDWIGRMDMFREQVKDSIPNYDLRYALPIGPVGKWLTLDKVVNYGICIANNPNKEAALKLMDYVSSPSGAELMTMGIEGVTYEKDGSGNIAYPELADREAISIKDLEEKYGMFAEGTYTRMAPESVYFNLTEREKEAEEIMVKNDRLAPNDPILKFTDEEQAKLNQLEPNLASGAIEFAAKYVMESSYGDKEWDDWVKRAESLKINEVNDIYNQAQKRFDEGK